MTWLMFCNDLITWLFLLVCHWAVVHTQVNGSLQACMTMEGICISVLTFTEDEALGKHA